MSHQGQSFSETETTIADKDLNGSPISAEKTERHIVWRNVVTFFMLHLGFLYGFYLFLFRVKLPTFILGLIFGIFTGLGVTAGAHRLWSHKAYKARWPLRLLLVILQTIAFQDSVLHWARDHRMHHKYSETDADPHNPSRGFFFSHIGWLLVRKHLKVKTMGKTIDLSDLWADPFLRFQKKYYLLLAPLACFVLPTYIPTLWGESAWNAFFTWGVFRFVYVLNCAWLINSAAHRWGTKPYDKNMKPADNKYVSSIALGEGFHNYHHTFPWDYKSAELGSYTINYTKLFIDAMAKMGWAYDLKFASNDVIEKRVKRTGDGSHSIWGWDDKDILPEETSMATIIKSTEETERD